MNKRLNEIKELIEIYSLIWQEQLHIEWKYKNQNVSNAFKGIGAFGETIAAMYNDKYVGSGSGGMGYDLIDINSNKEIEVKTAVTFQSNKCKDCVFKFSKLFNSCTICHSTNYSIVNDSRFGINAKSLISAYNKKVINSILAFHIFDLEESFDFNNGEIKFKINCWEIRFNYDNSEVERKRIQYFKNQLILSSKSNNCNLLPLSYDFWLLSPKLYDSWDITINFKNINKKPIVINAWSEKLSKIVVNINVCKGKKEKDKFSSLNSYKDLCVSLEDFVKNFDYRTKTFNKDRGKILDILDNKKK